MLRSSALRVEPRHAVLVRDVEVVAHEHHRALVADVEGERGARLQGGGVEELDALVSDDGEGVVRFEVLQRVEGRRRLVGAEQFQFVGDDDALEARVERHQRAAQRRHAHDLTRPVRYAFFFDPRHAALLTENLTKALKSLRFGSG